MIKSDDFLRGFAIALADIMRLHTPEVEVRDTIEGAGLSIADFERAGVEEYDLAELRKAFVQ